MRYAPVTLGYIALVMTAAIHPSVAGALEHTTASTVQLNKLNRCCIARCRRSIYEILYICRLIELHFERDYILIPYLYRWKMVRPVCQAYAYISLVGSLKSSMSRAECQ